jgi:protein TonB
MILRGILPRSARGNGPRFERPVWPGLVVFIGLSLLVHALLAQLNWYQQVPAAHRAERLIVSLFAPPAPAVAVPAPRPVAPRSKALVPKPAPPALGAPVETPPAVESPTATAEVAGSPEGVDGGDHAGEMADLIKRIQKKAVPRPELPAMTRATERDETNPRPQYPALARANRWQGVVHMQVAVSAEGRVGRITITQSSGYDVLDDAAINAVRYWRFVPARRGEEEVADTVSVSIPFPGKK